MPYLFVAQVDRIQTFIASSAKLRQLVGASAMLKTFSDNVRKDSKSFLGVYIPPENIYSSAGGSFRIRCETIEEYKALRDALCYKFDQEIGGHMTIVDAIEYESEDGLIQRGNDALFEAQSEGDDPTALWHLPHHALCQSSGSELAYQYTSEYAGTTEAGETPEKKYLGRITLEKGKMRHENNIVLQEMLQTAQRLEGQSSLRLHDTPTDAEVYAKGEGRQYVAYLQADGNNMGSLFNSCTPQQLKVVSERLEVITREALAKAIEGLIGVWVDPTNLPILPLIMGGDDVFAVMPAKWAFDVARRFCDFFEKDMQDFLAKEGISFPVTVGASVIICKSSYPYKVAHNFGHHLLEKVKDVGKQEDIPITTVGIDMISGSDVRTSASTVAYPLEIAKLLLDHRRNLNHLPSRVREGFVQDIELRRGVDKRMKRYEELSNPEQHSTLKKAFEDVGDVGIYQLFTLWDFLLNTDHSPADYMKGIDHVSRTKV